MTDARMITRYCLTRTDNGNAPGLRWGTVLFFVDTERDTASVVYMDGHNTIRTERHTVAGARVAFANARRDLGDPEPNISERSVSWWFAGR